MNNYYTLDVEKSISFGVCSCGYFKKALSSLEILEHFKNGCPKCGAAQIVAQTGKEFLKKKEITYPDKYTINISLHEIEYNYIKDTDSTLSATLEILKDNSYEYEYCANREVPEVFTKNGKPAKVSTLVFKKLGDKVQVLSNTFFYEVKYICNYKSLNEVLELLHSNPQYGIYYTTYGDLPGNIFDDIQFVSRETKPYKFLGVGKKELVAIRKNNWNLKLFKELRDVYHEKIIEVMELMDKYPNLDVPFFLERGYKIDRLNNYVNYEVPMLQGLRSNVANTSLRDYIILAEATGVKYERYPKNLMLRHNIMIKNKNLSFDEKKQISFTNYVTSKEYLNQALMGEEYSVYPPKEIKDIINEGQQLSHSVAAYIEDIINKKTQIYFLRKTTNPTKSLITLEVSNGIIIQYRGKYNRDPNEKELAAIESWAIKKGLCIQDQVSY